MAITGATRPLPKSATAMIAMSSDGNAKTTSKMRPSTASIQPPRHPASRPSRMPMIVDETTTISGAEQRGAGAEDHAAQDVAAERVGAEPVRGRRARVHGGEVDRIGIVGRDARREHGGERHHGDDGEADRRTRAFAAAHARRAQHLEREGGGGHLAPAPAADRGSIQGSRMSMIAFTTTKANTTKQHDRLHDREVEPVDRLHEQRADAGEAEGRLDDRARDEQAGDEQAADGEDRPDRVAEDVAAHDGARASRPRLVATSTCSRPSWSTIDERVTLPTSTTNTTASAIDGSTRWYTVSRNPSPDPNDGNQPSCTANTAMSTIDADERRDRAEHGEADEHRPVEHAPAVERGDDAAR